MDIARINIKVITDNSGVFYRIPALLTEHGILEPLVDYLLKYHAARSPSWANKVVSSTRLLMLYIDANQNCFANPHALFQSFSHRLYTGTIGDDGTDPSGLYWLPKRISAVNRTLSILTAFADWLAKNQNVQHMNPITDASSFEQRLQFAAWYKKNQYDFLGHISSGYINETATKTRAIALTRELIREDNNAIAFNENHFLNFFINGLGKRRNIVCAIRDQLILLLMHGAGVRESDALHLWVHDVYQDPIDSENVIVRLYHPEEGLAPDGWKSPTGLTTRSAYLKYKYNLTPRNKTTGTMHTGWKTKKMDHKDNYINLFWFPSSYGRLFKKLWAVYLRFLSVVDRNHPYAFISFSTRTLGKPYTLNAFNSNYSDAIKRIQLSPSKANGLSSHSHRHAYGRRMTKAKVDPHYRKKALHHSHMESQAPYVEPGVKDTNEALQMSMKIMDGSQDYLIEDIQLTWDKLLEHGFEDIDKNELFSGKRPKLSIKK